MSEHFQYGDIILLGLVALFVVLRLRSMLGRNSGIDPREIWKQAVREVPVEKLSPILDRMPKKPVVQEDILPPQLQENKPVSDGLKAIKVADASFSTTEFLSGSKLAFEWVVGAFSKGEKDKLQQLLSEERFQQFCADIDARARDHVTHETTLVAVVSADITEAALQGTRARITVQFTTEQIHLVRDKDNQIVGGDPSVIEKVIDIWTFERDTSSRDPNWKIIAT